MMTRRWVLFVSCWLLILPLHLRASEWDVKNIAPELLKDAHSVIRQKHKTYEFVSVDKVIVQIEFVVTVLNDKADDAAVLVIHYDEQSKVGKFKGAMYDKHGKQTKRLKNSDLYDRSNVAGYSLYEDNRVKIYRPASSQYPYTVSYSYQLVFNHTAISPRFLPVDQYRQSVESARLNILLHDGYEINYKAFNAADPKQETIKNGISLQWDFNQLPAVKSEAYSPPVEDIFPIIYFMPHHFAYDFYEGSNASWEDFGNWIALLNQGRQQLPNETIGYLKTLVADAATDREKAAILYEYMQKRTRYVNITLGIGGQQPIPANTIDRVGYGDCKALSNYMHAMLKAVGVDSYYTLINSGKNKYGLHEDLPGAQFNHVILCVPEENDTLWLECTSQQIPFGYIGRGNHNRPVLLITDECGVLGKTPQYGMDENRKTTTASVILLANGNGQAQIEIVSEGLFYSDIYGLESLPATDQERWIYRNFSFPNYHINKHEIENQKEVLPAFALHLDIDLRAYARSSTNRLFIPLNLTRGQLKQPERIKNRQHPFVIYNAYNYNDTIIYSLPEGFEIESGLQGFTLKDDFGMYDAEVEQIDNKLIYTRKLQLFSGRFDAKDYDRFVEFMGAIVSADNRQVVLKKVEY
jgi:hypothetical protein